MVSKVIISCTSTGKRLRLLYYSLQSISRQTYKPDIVLVNLSREQYLADPGVNSLPSWLSSLDFVNVQFVPNYGPYRKLLPALAMAGDDDLVVTFDDDVIYSDKWLERIQGLACENSDAIVCARARLVKRNVLGDWQSYSRWPYAKHCCRRNDLLPIGCGGVAYRKRLMDESFLHDANSRLIAPTCDDIWFRHASLNSKTEIVVDPVIDADNLYIRHHLGLQETNRSGVGSTFPSRLARRVIMPCATYFGLDWTKNDRAWVNADRYRLKKTYDSDQFF